MALVKRQTASSKTIIIAVIIVVVAVLSYFLYKKFVLDVAVTNTTNTGTGASGVITSFGEGLLNEPTFTELQPTTITPTVDVNKDPGQPQPFQ